MSLRLSLIVLLFLIIGSIVTVSGAVTAKGFYCRDPDTGKLYPVNSTWISTTFCGSYTCKLRKKSQESLQTPIRQYEIARENLVSDAKNETPVIGNIKLNCSVPVITGNKIKSDVENILHKNSPEDDVTYVNLKYLKKPEELKDVELGATTDDGDRYLTEEEITALTLLLQTMKKSDLEAILEVYNIAQDIYKEIDRVADQTLVQNKTQDFKTVENQLSTKHKEYVSYWYEPLTAGNSKSKTQDLKLAPIVKQVNVLNKAKVKNTGVPDSYYEGTNLLEVPSTADTRKASQLKGPLNRDDFRKLPYYHPITNFQRQSSYLKPTNPLTSISYPPTILQQTVPYTSKPYSNSGQYIQRTNPSGQYVQTSQYDQMASLQQRLSQQQQPSKCCKHSDGSLKKIGPLSKIINKAFSNDYSGETKIPTPYTEAKINAQTLQYPLAYLQQYNFSNLPNPYFNGNSWNLLNLQNNQKQNNDITPYVGTKYVAQMPNAILANSNLKGEIRDRDQDQDYLQSSNEVKKEKLLPEWQTNPLTLNILNEVKANIEKSRLLPFPFRKQVKLERVGRLIKIDDLSRIKRGTMKPMSEIHLDDFEVYIEKSTCRTDTEPGFFRMGNTSQPYPACCPQRISS